MENTQKNNKMSVTDFGQQVEREDIIGTIRSRLEAMNTATTAVLRHSDNDQLRGYLNHLDVCLDGCRGYVKRLLCDEQ